MAKKIHSIIPGAMYVSAGGALYTIASSGDRIPTQSQLKANIARPFAPWSSDNRMPHRMADLIRASTVLAPAIKKMSKLLYADGIKYQFPKTDATGKVIWEDGVDSEIDDWLEESDVASYFRNACFNQVFYENVFAGIQTNVKKDRITRIWAEKTEQCRYGWQDDNGYIPNVYVSANWKLSNDISKALKIPVIDPTFKLADQIANKKGTRFILPLSWDEASADENFYHTPGWYSAILSKWYDFAASIPTFKDAMMRNQIALKYHIEIDLSYWEWKFGDEWNGFAEDKKTAFIKAEINSFNENMMGAKNALNTLVTHSRTDGSNQMSYWKVTPIDDKIKSGVYIEDSQEASSHMLYALGCDPALIGSGPGKNYGSGSGSDKNAAYNIFMMESKPTHDNLIKPIAAASRFNGFTRKDRPIKWIVGRPMMVQMDSGKPKANSNPKPEQSNP